MNNNELEIKIKEIINTSNYFDMIIKAKEFEPEYKKSIFYKDTKKSLNEVIKESKIFYAINFDTIKDGVQNLINNLNYENINEVINEFSTVFGSENEEIEQSMEDMKVLLEEIKD